MDPSLASPLFSVVVCTYNRAELLPRAVDSVLAQTCDDFELVIVDDGSTDDTSEVVAGFTDPRVRSVHQHNQGLGVARNTGVAHSRGRFVVFLDDDDLALPRWLEELGDAIDGDCAAVCCGAVLTYDDGTRVGTEKPHPLGPAFADFTGLFLPGTFALRPDVYEAAGGFRPGLPHLHHTEFALRLLPVCRARGWRVCTTSEPLVQYHILGTRRSGPPSIELRYPAVEYILREHRARLALDPWVLATYSAVAGRLAALSGDFPEARRYLRDAVRAQPRDWRHWGRLALASVPPVGRRVWAHLHTKVPGDVPV